MVAGDDATEAGEHIEVVAAPPRRTSDRGCLEANDDLQASTGLSGETIALAIDDAYHTLDLLDHQLMESGALPFARLVELANLSSMIGNMVGGAIARHSGGLYER